METQRLILRPWTEADTESLYKYAKDPAVGPIAGWTPHTSLENSREVIRNILSSPETYAVVLKETNEPVGSVGIMFVNDVHSADIQEGDAEIGYWIGVQHWGKGLIPEAVKCLLKRCFEELDIKRVWCGYYDGNIRSRRVMDKCGFKFHHTEENKVSPLGDVRTEHFTLLTKNEWNKLNRNKSYHIRPLLPDETHLLKDFLYEAIFIPEGEEAPSREVVDLPELKVYIENFGEKQDDYCLLACCGNKVAGAVWSRIMNDYGHIDDKTPSLSISLYKEYRNKGIGSCMMRQMIELLKEKNYERVSLSVQKANKHAFGLYLKHGFKIAKETKDEYIMVKGLKDEKTFNIESWLEIFTEKILHIYGSRLHFFGIQGSYGRGEQKKESDIDVVVIIDRMTFDDLKSYRDMLEVMENRELICGFVAGKDELSGWEKSDLLQLYLDTKPIIGSLEYLKPMFSHKDIYQSVLNGACNLYHACSHNFLHSRSITTLKELYKSACFTIRMKYYMKKGEYVSSLNDIAECVSYDEAEILNIAKIIKNTKQEELFDIYSRKLIEWCSKIIRKDNVKSYKIRTLTEKDIIELQQLFIETVLNVNSKDYTKEEVEDWASCGNDTEHFKELLRKNIYIGAFDKQDCMVGFSSMNREGYLHSMFIHKNWQSKGVASRLLSEVEKIAEQYGVNEIVSEVSLTAKSFFENKGYEVVNVQKSRANKLELTNFRMKKVIRKQQ